ncbi:MAG: hypothetical protein AB7P03_00720 [Kofleriaceae bacterium]
MMRLVLVVLCALPAACTKPIDHGDRSDADTHDAYDPDPLVLGPQLDRMGRPYVSNLLIAPVDDPGARAGKRDAYNRATDPGGWATTVIDAAADPQRTIVAELAASIALYDAFTVIGPNVCGSGLFYQSPPSPTSYVAAATLFADDRLVVDTTKLTCEDYLAVELGPAYATSGCGGRTPVVDVFDTTFTVLVMGKHAVAGFGDQVAAHADVSATVFPFLGAPH